MEIYNRILELITINIIYCLPPIILTLILVELIFKNRFETKKVLNLFRWVIIIYVVISLIFHKINSGGFFSVQNLNGPYLLAFWTMIIGFFVMPLSLLYNKLGFKKWYILLVSIGLNIGVLFERFIIIITSLHRDFGKDHQKFELVQAYLYEFGMFLLQGIILALISLVVFQVLKRRNTVYNTAYTK